MESKTNYSLIGFLVLLFIAAVIAGGLWLSVGFEKKVYRVYAVYMNEPVFGLTIQAPVKFNGVKVGYVTHIALNKADPQQVVLLLNVEEGTPVTTSTTAVLQSQGITGIRYVELHANSRYAGPLTTVGDEPYPVIPAKPSLWMQLDAAMKDVTENFQQISDAVSSVLDKENALAIKTSFRNIEQITSALAHQSKTLSNTIGSAEELFKNAAHASKSLPEVIETIHESGEAVKDMAISLRQAGNVVSSTMQAGRQTIQTFKEQTLPQTTVLLDKLDAVAKNIKSLSQELKQNPSMLIRGKQARRLGPGER